MFKTKESGKVMLVGKHDQSLCAETAWDLKHNLELDCGVSTLAQTTSRYEEGDDRVAITLAALLIWSPMMGTDTMGTAL